MIDSFSNLTSLQKPNASARYLSKGFPYLLSFALVTHNLQSINAIEPVFVPPYELTVSMQVDNPFFYPSQLPFEAPDFNLIQIEHFMPGFEKGMAEQADEIGVIALQEDAPSFENTIVAMEKTGAILKRVQSVFFNLSSADTNDDIQAIERVIAPKLSAHSDNIFLNPQLFERVQSLWDQKDDLGLTEEQSRLLKETYEQFVRAGAKLSEEEKNQVRAINEEMSTLRTQFSNNLLSLMKERSLFVDDASKLEGLSPAEIVSASEVAKQRGFDGKYCLVISNTTRHPLLASLKNRETRRKLWEASAYRGLGRDGEIDNRPIVLRLAKLRAERAKLLGYANHAEFSLERQMAGTPEAARKMLEDLAPKVRFNAEREAEKIKLMMENDGISGPVEPWDWEYYAEKVRVAEYSFDENQLKPYFELESVLNNGLFFTMNRLYGIQFQERKDLPVYHPDVRVFNVLDSDGSPIGLFYADYFKRDSKRGGAWMNSFVSQSRLLNQLPVVVNVMNIPKPTEGNPALMSLDEVMTMFHELGHGVHGLFSQVEYPSLSGTSVPRDYVEFPSTFHEDWAIDPNVLRNFAKHYETGESIPNELLEKAIAASTFNKGYDTFEYLSAALLDLEWHALTPDQIPEDLEEFEAQTLASLNLNFAAIPPRYKSQYFAHIWGGGYSAGYYAYIWSEVLAADAFEYMRTRGGLTSTNGMAFRNLILSKGASREVMQQYIDFRGEKPKVDGLLKRRGLSTTIDSE